VRHRKWGGAESCRESEGAGGRRGRREKG
jgi:hypothetical protein